jgi:hypothetical protein
MEQFVIGIVGDRYYPGAQFCSLTESINGFPCKILNTGLEDFQ